MISTADKLQIKQQPQRQDSLSAQLRDLHILAARVGMYDAADWLWKATGRGAWAQGRETGRS